MFYSKNNNIFHEQEKKRCSIKQLVREVVNGKLVNKKDNYGNLMYRLSEDKKVDNVWRIPALQPASKDWTGYPTQKHRSFRR